MILQLEYLVWRLSWVPLFLEYFITYYLEGQLHGFAPRNKAYVEFLYVGKGRLLNIGNLALYIAIISILIFAGYFIYKARNLENQQEVVAFPSLRPVFIAGVAFCSGAMGYAYFDGFTYGASTLAFLPFGVIGIIIATMIAKKSLKVLKAVWKPVAVYAACVLIVFTVVEFDIAGYEKRVPQKEQIEGVTIDLGINTYQGMIYHAGDESAYVDNFMPYITDDEGIENITEFHKYLSEKKEDYSYNDIVIEYTLKNGKTLKRQYSTNYDTNGEYFEKLFQNKEMRKYVFPILRYDNIQVTDVQVSDIQIDRELYVAFIEALKQDMYSVSYEECLHANHGYYWRADSNGLYIEIEYKLDGVEEKIVNKKNVAAIRETYFINNNYENTISFLTKNGLY